MGSTIEKEYAAFEEKVKRTVYLDNLSPQVTESVLRTAIDQFGTVVGVHFIPNYEEPITIQQFALVEMQNLSQAKAIISTLAQCPFMMSGMPRPVRASKAEPEMFDDRPAKHTRKIKFRWLDPKDPSFEEAKKAKHLVKKQEAEAAFLVKQQLLEEEKLAKQQQDSLKGNYKKYQIMDTILTDGTARRLARYYGMHVADES